MFDKTLITGIGSMPHKEPKEALDLIFSYLNVPFWPQLPKRDIREGMCIQFSEGFSFLNIFKEGFVYNRKSSEKKLQDFYLHIINEDIDYFKISSDYALGLYYFYEKLKEIDLKDINFIKIQLTGPFTFAGAIKDEENNFILQDHIIMEAVTKGLVRKALWQIKFLKEFKKKIIVFFDEPYLSCFGSAYTPINREEIVKILSQLFSELKELALEKFALREEDILLGIHCCGNTDWSIFLELADLDIISFDAFSYAEKLLLYTNDLKKFLEKKKVLCWGIVPTLEFNEEIDKSFVLKRFDYILNEFFKKGIDKELILEKIMLSPSCGLGNLEEKETERIFSLLLGISFSLIK